MAKSAGLAESCRRAITCGKDSALSLRQMACAALAGAIVLAGAAAFCSCSNRSGSAGELPQAAEEMGDSLRADLFGGFYLQPAQESGDGNAAAGRLAVYNAKGEKMELPGAPLGLDSLCLANAPLIEYIDNGGLRRAVALFAGDVYYYLGECGSYDGTRQYALANRKGKCGLADANGTVVRDFANDKIAMAPGGYSVVNGGVKQMYDFDGNAIAEKAQGKSKAASDDEVEAVRKSPSGKPYFKEKNGRIVARFDYIDNSYFKGNVKVRDNGKYGVYNTRQRRLVLPTVYDDVSIYGADLNMYPVMKNGKWGYAKAGGEVAIPCKFSEVHSFGMGSEMAMVRADNGKCGYIDLNGRFVIQPKYHSGRTMQQEGTVVMNSPMEYGYITKAGDLVAGWYTYMGNKFVIDRIFVRNKDNLAGFIDRSNHLVIPCIFDGTEPVFDAVTRLAKISYNGVEWYINENGAFCYPASARLKPSEQNIQEQISKARNG